MVTLRHLELRFKGPEGMRKLRVVPSDGPRTHGLSCTLYVGDEVWAWAQRAICYGVHDGAGEASRLEAADDLHVGGRSRLAAWELRRRAMGMSNVHRAGPVVEAKSRDFHWLEWSLGEQHELDNLRVDQALQPGAVDRCRGSPPPEGVGERGGVRAVPLLPVGDPRGPVVAGGGLGGLPGGGRVQPGREDHARGRRWRAPGAPPRSAGSTRSHTSACEIFEGEDAVFEASEVVLRLAEQFSIAAVNFDPWRAAVLVLRVGLRDQFHRLAVDRREGHSCRVRAVRRDHRGQAHSPGRRGPR